ncbi:hypothetical protein Emag_000894 [Eimeria magna]
MQFVKSSVYQAEITEGGVREREVDTRSREEVELQERLRRLPEFSRNPNFKSYAEQVWEGLPSTTPEAPPSTEGKQNPNLPHSVTEEEFEFYEALRAQDRRKKLARQREEDEMRDEFHKAREASLRASVGSAREHRSSETESSTFGAPPKLSPFAALGAQKQRTRRSDSPLGEGSIFDVTTKAFKEKQRKRAIDARRTFNLIIKKPKCEDSSAAEAAPAEAADSASGRDKDASEDEAKKEKEQDTAKKNGIADAAVNAFASLCEAYGDSDDSG